MVMFEVYSHQSGTRFRVRWQEPRDLAIPLDFDGPQPSYFVESSARRRPVAAGSFIGDIHAGGSCNVDFVELIPHCHGTHTETISHVADPFVAIGQTCPTPFQLARLVSVTPVLAKSCVESYSPPLRHTDRVITAVELRLSEASQGEVSALIVRTLPNPPEKRAWTYSAEAPPAFFTNDAMRAIVAAGIEHLLVDLPTVDRMDDGGTLSNHRLFWNIMPAETNWTDSIAARRTISEMLYIPSEIPDGLYALTISVPSWRTDAAPSRPLLYHLEPV
jgi:hypothetical protein